MNNGLKILVAFAAAWLLAQLAKLAVAVIMKNGAMTAREVVAVMMKSGGMPSGHAASFTAATVTIGFVAGFDSAVFALAVCTAVIVIYDAVNVRWAVGEQGRVINTFMQKSQGKKLRVVEGHTVPQVVMGIILGLVVSYVISLVF